jgi:hypothetical protein
MKKAWKWSLALFGFMLLCVVFLVVDSYYRAVASIAAQDARLKVDIAALQAKHVPSQLLRGLDLSPDFLTSLPCPVSLFRPGLESPLEYEKGHSGQRGRNKIWAYDLYPRSTAFSPPREVPTAQQFLIALAVTRDTMRTGGYDCPRRAYEIEALNGLGRILAEHAFEAAELRKIRSDFDLLLSSRPTFEDIMTAEYVLDRAQVLSVIHTRSDPYTMIRESPGWKEFFSWRILIAKALNELDDNYRFLRDAKPGALLAGTHETQPQIQRRGGSTVFSTSELRSEASYSFQIEIQTLSHWKLAQVALAVALFQTEKQREPKDLGELIPEYFTDLPLCPGDGRPFEFHGGILGAEGLNLKWPVKRK